MKSKINTLILLAVAFLTFSVGNSGAAPQQYSTALLKDGPGPMLLSDGGGPMCIPDTPCGHKFDVAPDESRFSAEILLTDGAGPMCIPGTACTSRAVYALGNRSARLIFG